MADEKLSAEERVFGEQVRRLREERGWSQAVLARQMIEAGIAYANPSMLSRIEAALRPVRMMEALVLSRLLQRNVESLLYPDERESVMNDFRYSFWNAELAVNDMVGRAEEAGAHQRQCAERLADLRGLFTDDDDVDPRILEQHRVLVHDIETLATADLGKLAADSVRRGLTTEGTQLRTSTLTRLVGELDG